MASTELLNIEECHVTQVEKGFAYKWVIHNFNCKISINERELPSTNFKFNYRADFQVTGQLSISGKCSDRSCKLLLMNIFSKNFTVHAKVWVVEEGEDRTVSLTLTKEQNILNKSLRSANVFQNPCFLCAGKCTILCKITFLDYIENVLPSLSKNNKRSHHDVELFNNKNHWDVTFVIAEKKLHAHKCILASRNKVFAAMFEHEMKESKSNIVTITDADAQVFEELLRYIYTGEILNLKSLASELLGQSEKYDLQDLKIMCVNELVRNISTENSVEILILADLYSVEELKNCVINFINGNRKEVSNTAGWNKILCKTHILSELYLKS